MKTTLSSLLLLSVAFASAQTTPDRWRDNLRDARDRFDGTYQALQRDGTVRRVLRLDRNGTLDLTTTVREDRSDSWDTRNDERRNGLKRRVDRWSDEDTQLYGRTAAFARRRGAVRHTGSWWLKDDRIVVRLDELRLGEMTRSRFEMVLDRERGSFVFDRNSDVYGDAKIVFRRDDGWDGGRPNTTPRFGFMRYDGDRLRIEGVDLVDGRGSDGRLVIRAEGRRIELRGDIRRGTDLVTFRLPYDGRDGGEYELRLRDGRVESIRGSGSFDHHRVDIEAGGRE